MVSPRDCNNTFRRHIGLLLIGLSLLMTSPCSFAYDGQPVNYTTVGDTWGDYPPVSSTIPEEFVLRNETALRILSNVASKRDRRTGRRAIVFTTLRLAGGQETFLQTVSTFCYHLHQQGVLKHTMLITTDEESWHAMRSRGFPAYLDRSYPRRSVFATKWHANDTFSKVKASLE